MIFGSFRNGVFVSAYKYLSEAVEEYLQVRRARYAVETVTNEGYVLRRFVAWYGDVQVRNLSAERVAAWFYADGGLMHEHRTRDRRKRAPVAASTHNYYRTRLKAFFNFCNKRAWLRRDLLADVHPMPVLRRQRQQPSPEKLLALVEAADNDRDRAFIATTINTGLRSKEVLNLRVSHVDLCDGWLSVLIYKSSEEDLLPITSDLAGELREWLRQYALDLGRPLHPDDYLFPARKGSVYRWTTAEDGTKVRGRTPATWVSTRPVAHTERIVQDAMARVGLPTRNEGTHTIRRAVSRIFFDSMADDQGYDAALRTVSALLHHQSSATTERYLGLSSERKRRDDRLRGKPFLTSMVTDAQVFNLPAAKQG